MGPAREGFEVADGSRGRQHEGGLIRTGPATSSSHRRGRSRRTLDADEGARRETGRTSRKRVSRRVADDVDQQLRGSPWRAGVVAATGRAPGRSRRPSTASWAGREGVAHVDDWSAEPDEHDRRREEASRASDRSAGRGRRLGRVCGVAVYDPGCVGDRASSGTARRPALRCASLAERASTSERWWRLMSPFAATVQKIRTRGRR